MSNSANAFLTAQNIHHAFAKHSVLEDVSISVNAGQVVALLGPNGAGKTTLINCLLGRIKANAGSIQLFSNDHSALKQRSIKQQIGVMLQHTEVTGNLTIREHISVFSSYYPNAKPIEQTLGIAELTAIADKPFKKLSGGEKQKLLFALAICGTPKLLFLDEPTVGLDVNSRRNFWQQISQLKQQGTGILLTTHYLEEAEALADHIVLLNQGKIIKQGSADSIKNTVTGKRIRFQSQQDIDTLSQFQHVAHISQQGNYYEIITDQGEQLSKQLLNNIADIHDLSIEKTNLEDAFIHFTQSQPKSKPQQAA